MISVIKELAREIEAIEDWEELKDKVYNMESVIYDAEEMIHQEVPGKPTLKLVVNN